MNLKVDTRFQTWAHTQDKKEALKTKQAQVLPQHLNLENEMAQNIAKTQQGNIQDTQEDISLLWAVGYERCEGKVPNLLRYGGETSSRLSS